MILLMDTLEMTPVNARQVKQWTDHDSILSKVRTKVQKGDRRPMITHKCNHISKEWTNSVSRMDVLCGVIEL
jgi:hypothetical protein